MERSQMRLSRCDLSLNPPKTRRVPETLQVKVLREEYYDAVSPNSLFSHQHIYYKTYTYYQTTTFVLIPWNKASKQSLMRPSPRLLDKANSSVIIEQFFFLFSHPPTLKMRSLTLESESQFSGPVHAYYWGQPFRDYVVVI